MGKQQRWKRLGRTVGLDDSCSSLSDMLKARSLRFLSGDTVCAVGC